MKPYELIDHTADIGIKAYGSDLKELFKNAAFAMFDIMADLQGLKTSVTVEVRKDAPNREELLIEWLDELLYNFYTKGLIFSTFEITELDDQHIVGKAHGRHIGENKSRLKTEIKAATYHDLKIEQKENSWQTQLIFDV
jgi:SHS2 domain-containing protein